MGQFPLSTKGLRVVEFIDECADEAELREAIDTLRGANISVAYVDCAKYIDKPEELRNAIGYAAGTDNPPYDGETPLRWVRWWDDLYSLGERSPGLIVVLDNSHLLFDAHRKVMTDLLEWFLFALKPWFNRGVPYGICFQMVPCAALRAAIGNSQNET